MIKPTSIRNKLVKKTLKTYNKQTTNINTKLNEIETNTKTTNDITNNNIIT